MKVFIKVISCMLILFIGQSLLSAFTEPAPTIAISIDTPGYNGYEVGESLVIQGKADVAPGQYVWVFTRRDNFAPLWYPQGSVEIDPADNSWYRMVYFGTQKDIGHKFDLAVAVFNETEHLKLKKYWENAMITENWTPIKMPKCESPPSLRKVLKISH